MCRGPCHYVLRTPSLCAEDAVTMCRAFCVLLSTARTFLGELASCEPEAWGVPKRGTPGLILNLIDSVSDGDGQRSAFPILWLSMPSSRETVCKLKETLRD